MTHVLQLDIRIKRAHEHAVGKPALVQWIIGDK